MFSERFLIKRPLLQALEPDPAGAPVLLIDELDRTDEAFEAFLLEVLSDFQVTIPELGTIKAEQPPIVIITSNRTREIHDALKRRCLYHWVGYPDRRARTRDPARQGARASARSCREQVVASCRRCASRTCSSRRASPRRSTGRRRLRELDAVALDPATVSDTLGVLLKYQDDIARLEGGKVKELLDEVQRGAAGGGVSAMAAMTDPQGRLADNIVYFARALRAAGIPVGPGSVLDALAAVRAAGIGTREDFYWTLHAVFVKRHEHSILFDQAFRIFFRKRGYLEKLIAMMLPDATGAPTQAASRRPAQRIHDALFKGAEKTSARSRRSSSTRASPCPTARCCRTRTSRR